MMLQWEDSRVRVMDCETSGTLPEYALQPWRHATGDMWITSFVHAWKEEKGFGHAGGLATPYDRPDDELTKKMIARFFEEVHDLDQYVTGWFMTYDVSLMLAYGFEKEVFRTKWMDGMLLWRHWFVEPEYEFMTNKAKKKSYGLKECFAELLPQLPPYNDDIDFHNSDPAERAKLHRYNVRDDKAAWGFSKHWFQKLQSNERRVAAAMIEAESIPFVAQANLHGLPIDTLYSKELQKVLQKLAAEKLEELAPHGVTKEIVRSPIKLATLLFDEWGLPVYKYNAVTEAQKKKGVTEGNRSTDKETLFELSFEDPRAMGVSEYRGAMNQETKFAVAPLRAAAYNGDGRAHPTGFIFSTYSSRMTYASSQKRKFDKERGISAAEFPTGIALHQWKREKEFRQQVIAPPGYDIVEADAAGQEFRWMAVASGDETMMSLCEPGEDPHSFMGSSIVGTEYHELIRLVHDGDPKAEQDRYLGKFANLSCASKDTMITTNRGLVSIQSVRQDDLIWDGEEFVNHGGVVYSGLKSVLNYSGLWATPDHKVLVNDQWIRFDDAARYGAEIRRSGDCPSGGTAGSAEVYDILDCGPRNRFVANGLIVHNCQYRTGKKKLRAKARVDYGIMLTMPDAERIHGTYQLTYPGVPVYWRTEIALVRQRGWQETFAGRRVEVTGNWNGEWGWSMGSTAINYKIQGTGGEQKYLAFKVLKPIARKYAAIFAWDLHDGLYWFVPQAKSKAFAVEMKQALDNMPYKEAWDFVPPVPMPWDLKIGRVWGSMKKFEPGS